jgi:carboxyl-terminal processing protease
MMEKNSLNRYTLDWMASWEKVLNIADGARLISDTYPAIRRALTLLGDNHSFYIKDNGDF